MPIYRVPVTKVVEVVTVANTASDAQEQARIYASGKKVAQNTVHTKVTVTPGTPVQVG